MYEEVLFHFLFCMEFSDKVVIITGGSSGIGFAAARLFQAAGAQVVLVGRNQGRLDRAIEQLGNKAFGISADVSLSGGTQKAVSQTIEKFGRLDILINNAGVSIPNETDLETFSEESFDETINLNFRSVFLMTKYAIPYLLASLGNVVNVSSRLGIKPLKDDAFIYASSKAAVNMFTKAMALNYIQKGVRFNAVCPGATDTPLLRNVFDNSEEFSSYVHSTPLGRIAMPEDIAHTILFLASEKAAYITGGIYPVDAGASI